MPRAAAETFAPSSDGTLAKIETSLLALLTASELHEFDAPAARAYRNTMRARGREVLSVGGTEAADFLVARIREADPAKADVREAILDTAWTGLSGWRS